MKRKLFCEISPLTYKISTLKCRVQRQIYNQLSTATFADTREEAPLPIVVYKHSSLIRRKLGNVDLNLQENKAVNLSLATPKVNHLLIRPNETFSFWRIVGNCTATQGYREGVTISSGSVTCGIGGGMCQFTNLIHWMVLHTPLTIVEHHHHDQIDLFPDYHRQVPFGTGTSIVYNYLDYGFRNDTNTTFQLITYTTDTHLCGEIRANQPLPCAYHIVAENEFFSREGGQVFRNGEIYRHVVDKRTGNLLQRKLLRTNHSRVCYNTSQIPHIREQEDCSPLVTAKRTADNP